MELTERKKKVLRSVVDLYIRTAEPVGSKAITELPDMKYSSATIRNEMADLTAMGLLEQPHTSAGRIPSAAGYRLYVDELMADYRLSMDETKSINTAIEEKMQRVDKMVEKVAKLVSQATDLPAISLAARYGGATVKRQAGLLSLPRDTYTVTDYGSSNKLNSAYGRNGGGEEGMEVLFDYVQDTIGYRPDGYVLIELPILQDLIDLFGGVDYDVPQDMGVGSLSGAWIILQKGMQHLDGEKALAMLRFRYGYVDQDLGRQNVQKNFLKECMKQWLTVENFGKITDVLELFKAESFTNLETKHFLWFGWNLLTIGFNNIYTDTLPGYATMIGDASYYVLYPGEVAEMIQDRYNPYKTEITRDMLDIATE